MTAWREIEAHLRGAWPVVANERGWCGLVVERGGARQHVVVKAAPGGRLIVAASVCPIERLEPEEALRYNSAAEDGMLMLEGRTFVLRQLVELDGLDRAIGALAIEAARLRGAACAAVLATARVATELFSFISD